MKLFIASDHAGFELKEFLKNKSQIKGLNFEWVDLGCANKDSVDYPDYAQIMCEKILAKKLSSEQMLEPQGILICGSGVGMSMAANRFKEIRAVLALRPDVAKLSREHNASNVLCLGARIVNELEAEYIVSEWIKTPFAGDRHLKRVKLMDKKL